MAKTKTLSMLIGVSIAIGAFAASIAPRANLSPVIDWLANAKPLPAFNLISTNGALNNISLQGHWTIVLFGYLNCPDVCPTGLMEMANLSEQLKAAYASQSLAFVFVSVDPERDTLVDLTRYVRHFNPSFIGATGDDSQISVLARHLGIRYQVSANEHDYAVAHSVTFSILDEQGRFIGRFSPGVDAMQLAKEIKARRTVK